MTPGGSEPEENIRNAFDLARDVAERPERYPDHFLVVPLDPEILRAILSEERVRMLRAIREEGPFETINELAAHLGRDQSRVSRDVTKLEETGLVLTERVGPAKRVWAQDREILLA